MTDTDHAPSARVRWARLRFQIVGPLLASPADAGELKGRIEELAARAWRHPTNGESIRFSFKTIERWWYVARAATDPFAALARKVHGHAGTHPSLGGALAEAIARQHRDHPRWSFQLHHDNLLALAREDPRLGPVPSYPTLCRFMKGQGLLRARKRRHREQAGGEPFVARETRSYEVTHVHGLWHLDFHQGSRPVLTASGQWQTPQLLGILDDRSRLCCHLQWYLDETAEALVHGLSQAFQKRALPRALLTDNGSAMLAAETVEGLERLGVVHHTTLPYSPEQNGKQESFWGQIEGRLLPMLEGEPELTLDLLNTATQAWVEQEYQRKVHSEIREAPLDRYLRGPSVGRESPGSDALRRAMRTEVSRKQRRSDGTVTVEGVRFEIPAAYRTLLQLRLRVARWDLASVDLVDPRSGDHLTTLLPIDKARNAERVRRVVAPVDASEPARPVGIAPHLRALMADYAATGLPPPTCPNTATTSHPRTYDQIALALRTQVSSFSAGRPDRGPLHYPRRRQLRPTSRASASPMAASPCSPAIRGRARASPCAFSPSAFAPCPMSWSAPSSIPRAAPWTSIASLGDLFSVPLAAHNRWAGFKALRTRWADHIGSSRCRPVLIIDEAQEALTPVLCELRILASKELDSKQLLCVVFAGDARLPERLRSLELQPLGSRIRRRLTLDFASRDELLACLDHLLAAAGNPSLMTSELRVTLADHAAGNYRVLMNLADELLAVAADREPRPPRREAVPRGLRPDTQTQSRSRRTKTMTPRQMHCLLIAPELIVVDLVEAALVALERALCVEHPLLDAPPPTEHPPVRRHARDVLRRVERLRVSLRGYRRVVQDILREAEQRDSPF